MDHTQNLNGEVTIEQLRQIPGFEKLDDNKLGIIAESLKEFAIIFNLIPNKLPDKK